MCYIYHLYGDHKIPRLPRIMFLGFIFVRFATVDFAVAANLKRNTKQQAVALHPLYLEAFRYRSLLCLRPYWIYFNWVTTPGR